MKFGPKKGEQSQLRNLVRTTSGLKPIEEADESEREFKEKKSTKSKQEGYSKRTQKAGEKPCKNQATTTNGKIVQTTDMEETIDPTKVITMK